ncbi:hypothetical protein C8T65DRAFT_97129 [Cerioporus squamosus]|nr:hypothetical protein C8T65DRAFT_97129 [Cerioporus squamosus]
MPHRTGLGSILDDPVRNLHLLRLVKSSGVASMVLLLSEILHGLDDEIAYLWPSRFSLIKFMYMVNRYSPLIDTTLELTTMLVTTNPTSCSVQYQITTYVYAAGAFFSEFILIGRTLALYNFDRRIVCLMSLLSLGVVVSSLVTGDRFLDRIQYPSEDVLKIIGCVPSIEDRPGWVFYCGILVSETVVVILTVYKRWQTSFRHASRSILVNTMYRDGTLYYFVMLSVSITNLCFMLVAPEAVSSIMQFPLRIVHSTLCARVLINLRKVAARLSNQTVDEFTRRSALTFEHFVSYDIPQLASPSGRGRVAHIELELGSLSGHEPRR